MPMVKMINIILKKNSIVNIASDIHIENGDHVRVRTRIDGVLATRFNIPIARHAAMIARVKILCGLKLDEKKEKPRRKILSKI